MNKSILSLLAIVSVALVGSVQANEPTSVSLTPADRNAALFASSAPVRVSGLYYYNGRRYYHRSFVGYRTERVVYVDAYGRPYHRHRRVAVYRYW